MRAHRFSYELVNGLIGTGLVIRHRCNNPRCVIPANLITGDHSANMADRQEAGNYPRNERHPNAKFSDSDVAFVRTTRGAARDVGAKIGMSPSQVRNIRRGEQRRPA